MTDFGQIELHTHALPGSSTEVPDETTEFGGGGEGGFGLGLVGLLGGVIAIAGRDGDDQPVAAAPPDEEEEKLGQK